jgi:hypothetical protein
MLIRFLSNGAEQQVSNEVGRGFITAGLAEEVQKVPAPKLEPSWSVIRDESGYAAIKMELGTMGPGVLVRRHGDEPQGHRLPLISKLQPTPQTVAYYHGDPDKIHDRMDWRKQVYCSCFGRPVPKEIVEQYRKARKNPKACAPAMPLKLRNRNDNAEMAQEMDRRNAPEKLLRPVITEHEALAAEEAKSATLVVVPPAI